jgi:hypothetical protein
MSLIFFSDQCVPTGISDILMRNGRQVTLLQDSNVIAKAQLLRAILVSFHRPSNKHAAPTELGNGLRGIFGYRHGAPMELTTVFQYPIACAKAKRGSS